jgi:hypothetical protein
VQTEVVQVQAEVVVEDVVAFLEDVVQTESVECKLKLFWMKF